MTDQDRDTLTALRALMHQQRLTQQAKGTIGAALYLLQYPRQIQTVIQALKDAIQQLDTLHSKGTE